MQPLAVGSKTARADYDPSSCCAGCAWGGQPRGGSGGSSRKRGREEEKDTGVVIPVAKQAKQHRSLSFDFGSTRPAAVVDSPYTLKVIITNRGTEAKEVKLGFSGVGLDYRGKRLIYTKTRSGKVRVKTI